MTHSMAGQPASPDPHEKVSPEPHPRGAILSVRARAGARSSGIQGVRAGELRISVTQVPEKGKANKVLAEVLSGLLELPKSDVELVSGETSPRKRFLVHGLTASELARRVAAAIDRL